MKTTLSILLLLFVFSCKKNEIQYHIIGTVADVNTLSAIKGVNLTISQKEVNTNVVNPNYVYITESLTDANGNYDLLFNREKVVDFKLEIENANFYSHEIIITPSELSTETTTEINIDLTAKAWVKVRLVNNNPEVGEQLNFYKHNVREGCADCCVNGYTIVYSDTPDSTFICSVVGNNYFKYSYGESSVNSAVTDSIYCSALDTTLLEIHY